MQSQQHYAVAWITTTSHIFRGACRMLNADGIGSAWKVAAPRDRNNGPNEYRYNTKEVNGHTVYLANAVHEDNVAELAGIMMNKLERKRIHVRMFFVSGICFIEDWSAMLPTPLTLDQCLFDTFNGGTASVSPEAGRNGQRLLTAATEYQTAQLNNNGQYVPLFRYNDQDPGLAMNMARQTDFFGLPAMAVFGMCHQADVSEDAHMHAGEVAGANIMGVLERMEKLESLAELQIVMTQF